MTPSLQQLTNALRLSWPVDAKNRVWDEWTPDNPARGQCLPSSLVVQDYFGGDIVRYIVRYIVSNDALKETHYFNVLDDGTVIDTTVSQYKEIITMKPEPIDLSRNNFSTVRERCLADDETKERYEILKHRVNKILDSNKDSKHSV